eukprot:449969-Prorocentrum_lima.AAC.1
MEWDDFSNDVRKKLANSHVAGTPGTGHSSHLMLVRLGDDHEDEALVPAMSWSGGEEKEGL